MGKKACDDGVKLTCRSRIITNTSTGRSIWYYEVEIKPFTQQVYPNLGPTRLVGYDGISPGPTFIIPRGQEAIVRFVNNAQLPTSVHLHGSYSRAPFEGWAEDTTNPGQYKDYYYPNSQEGRTMWYHDHAMGIVSLAAGGFKGTGGGGAGEDKKKACEFKGHANHSMSRPPRMRISGRPAHTSSRTLPKAH